VSAPNAAEAEADVAAEPVATRPGLLALVPVALSAALYSAAFPPLSLDWLAWVALVPLFVAASRLTVPRAAAAGLLWGVLAAYGCGWVLPGMVASYFGLPVAVGWLVFGVVSTLLAGIYFAAFSAWVAWVARARSAGALSVAAAWIVCELGRASLIVGNPWAMLGYSQIDHLALIQVADLGGPYLPTFLIAAVNAAIASLFARDLGGRWPRTSAVAVALLLLSTLGYGAIRLRAPLAGEASIAAAVVQSGHGRGFGWRPEYRREGLEDYLALTRGASAFSPTLVVWPENAVSFYLQEETPERDELLAVARELGVELVVGGPSYRNSEDGVRYRNSVYLVRSGRLAGRYDKLRLVPLAEADTLGALWPREQAYEPGHGTTSLRSSIGLLGTFVCFEAMYPELVRRFTSGGARVLVNVSNDDWFGHPSAARHHLDIARLRAVESRRWLLRATTTGYSAIVDPWGRVVAQSGFGEPAILSAQIVPRQDTTPYQRFGDAFAFGCAAWVAVVSTLRSRRRGASAADARTAGATEQETS
jgi:apolipoprotein N-acyltransferase